MEKLAEKGYAGESGKLPGGRLRMDLVEAVLDKVERVGEIRLVLKID